MHRFFAVRLDENRAELPPEEEAHALRVLRMNAGDECQALIEGNLYGAVIEETSPGWFCGLGICCQARSRPSKLPCTRAFQRGKDGLYRPEVHGSGGMPHRAGGLLPVRGQMGR